MVLWRFYPLHAPYGTHYPFCPCSAKQNGNPTQGKDTSVSANSGTGSRSATAIAVTSGKGGVGKTSLATNLGIALSRQGHRVCLLDADMGLANVNILLGLRAEKTVEDLLAGSASLDDVMLTGPEGLQIVPAASDLRRIANESALAAGVDEQLRQLEAGFDYLLVDTPAGIGANTLSFIAGSDHTLLTITQEPTSLTDAFTLLKTMQRTRCRSRISVVVNMLPAEQDGEGLFAHFQAAAERYLNLPLDYLGHLVMDSAVTRAVLRQRPVLMHAPESRAAAGLLRLGEQLHRWAPPRTGEHRFSQHWMGATPGGEPAPGIPAEDDVEPAPPVIQPPAAMREQEPESTPPQPSTLEPGAIAAKLQAWLSSPDTDDAAARQVFSGVDQAFSRRFRRRASDIKTLVYEALLQGHLGRDQHRELVQSLFAAYRRRYGGSYRPDAQPERLDQLDDDALSTRLEELHGRLAEDSALARRLITELLDAAIAGPSWSRENALALARQLSRAEEARGSAPLLGHGQEQRLAALERALAQRGEAVKSLQNSLEMLLRQQTDLEQVLSDPSLPPNEP